jgi:hypothetical protein
MASGGATVGAALILQNFARNGGNEFSEGVAVSEFYKRRDVIAKPTKSHSQEWLCYKCTEQNFDRRSGAI